MLNALLEGVEYHEKKHTTTYVLGQCSDTYMCLYVNDHHPCDLKL